MKSIVQQLSVPGERQLLRRRGHWWLSGANPATPPTPTNRNREVKAERPARADKYAGKTNVELVALKNDLCSKPENQMPAGSFWRFTAPTRKKLDDIDRAITSNLRAARLLSGE